MNYYTRNSFRLTVLLLATTCLAGRMSAQIISNGSFELPGGLEPNTSLELTNGDPRLVGWIVGVFSGHIGYMNGKELTYGLDFPPVEGSYHIAFNGGDSRSGAWVAQSFDTAIGEQYEVTFYVGRYGPNNTPNVLKLTATARTEGGIVLTNIEAIAPIHGYSGPQRFTFLATTPRTILEFFDTSSATVATDLLLDAVSVSPKAFATIEVSEVAICWIGSTNRMYQVQYRSDLTSNTWVNLGAPVQGTGSSMCIRDEVLGLPRRFYQVVPLP